MTSKRYSTLDNLQGTTGLFSDGDWIETKDQSPLGEIRLIQLADIGDGRFLDKSNRHVTNSTAKRLNCTFLKKNDVLIARMPDPLGRACVFPLPHANSYITVVDVAILRVDHSLATPRYVCAMMNAPQTRKSIELMQSGTTRSRITRKNLATIQIPLPPLLEQERIVARIEELFSELDKGVEALHTINAQLKVYREAVLNEAFEGNLTGSHTQAKQALGDFIEVPRYGTAKKCSFDNVENSTPVYRIPNIHPVLGVISHSDIKSACFSESELAPIRLGIGDILIIRSNGSPSLVGRAAIIREFDTDGVFAGYLLRLRINKPDKLDSFFLLHFLASHESRVYIERTARSTSGVNNISAGEICQLKIPIYSLQDQKQIVTEIESRLSVCDKIEQIVDESLNKAESLRQSILKKAFEGRL